MTDAVQGFAGLASRHGSLPISYSSCTLAYGVAVPE